MKEDAYAITNIPDSAIYEFTSKGPKGNIKKRILFQKTEIENLFALSFGDVISESGKIDVYINTNNSDRNKVLTTVAAIAAEFIDANPNATVAVVGSTPSRTRLYQIALSMNYKFLSRDFEIFGWRNNQYEL